MKNKLSTIGIIILVMLAGLTIVACNNNPFKGTWTGVYAGSMVTIVITDSTFTMTGDGQTVTGGFSRNGNTGIISANGYGETITVSGRTMILDGMTFTKQ